MEGLLSVSIGTVFWASLAFLVVLFILKKYAWGPILKSLDERSQSIENALNEAEKARQEMTGLKAGNEALLKEARNERDRILKESKEVAEKVKADIEARARENAERLMANARVEIDNQKKAAMTELKNYMATLSIDIAEKLVKEKLSDGDKQKALNHALAAEINAN
ncbi:MAG: F0F1 ATP synthase subunit B [Flavobacteriales bacterium]|nr:F0F1 ATP synthase subunit B [Flavobacteriales bacterium]